MSNEVSFQFPRDVAEQLQDVMLPAVLEAVADPNDGAKNMATVDHVALLLDMALSLCGRAHSLLTADPSAEGRKRIVAGIQPAWKGVYGWSLDSLWKRRLIQAVDFVARIVMIHRSGARAHPTPDLAGPMVVQVLFRAMELRFLPFVNELGNVVEAWRIQKDASPGKPGKFVQLAKVYTLATKERVKPSSLEQLFRRMKSDNDYWDAHERLLVARARAAQIHPDVRLDVLGPGETL